MLSVDALEGMVVDIRETRLPGVGMRHEFTTKKGQRIGVVSHRTGQREVFICPPGDPDTPEETIYLDEEESVSLSELLGGSRVVQELSRLQHEVEGLAIDWVSLPAKSPYEGGTIADTESRSRTGVSIVAILRDGEAIPTPTPDTQMQPGDTLLVVGTPRGIRQLVELLVTD